MVTIVYVNEIWFSYVNNHLSVGNVRIDIDQMLIDPRYIDRTVPGLSTACKAILKFVHTIDAGIYQLQSSETRTVNLLSGVYTESNDYGELFSFRTMLHKILD